MTPLDLLAGRIPAIVPMCHVCSFQGNRSFSRGLFAKVSSKLSSGVDVAAFLLYLMKYSAEAWYPQGIHLVPITNCKSLSS